MMARRLEPLEDFPALASGEIERRLRAAFAHAEAESEAGAEVVASMIRQFERMGAPHPRLLASIFRFVVALNFADAYLSVTAMPCRGLLVGDCSARRRREVGR